MKTIRVNQTEIDIHDGPIGVSVSGGADSAVLLYILMKHAPGPIHVYTCVSKEKHRVAPHIALDVIGKCMDLTGRKDIQHHSYFVDQQTFKSWIAGLTDVVMRKQVNIMYTAVTSLPPLEVLKTFRTDSTLMEKRNPNEIRPVYNGAGNKFYSPFFNINKQDICKLYEELSITEELYSLTRSCEDLNLTEGHCGTCWWCEERLWGFGKI